MRRYTVTFEEQDDNYEQTPIRVKAKDPVEAVKLARDAFVEGMENVDAKDALEWHVVVSVERGWLEALTVKEYALLDAYRKANLSHFVHTIGEANEAGH